MGSRCPIINLNNFRNQFQMKYSNKVDERQHRLPGLATPHLKSSNAQLEQFGIRRFAFLTTREHKKRMKTSDCEGHCGEIA